MSLTMFVVALIAVFEMSAALMQAAKITGENLFFMLSPLDMNDNKVDQN
jgi:hypothetical protein